MTSGRFLRRFTAALLCGAGLLQIGPVAAEPVHIRAERIERFESGSEERRFGAFEFLGGLELSARDNSLFGAWSSIRLTEGGQGFIGVLDTGHWITGGFTRDGAGRISGITDSAIEGMLDDAGRKAPGKGAMDAESLALRGEDVFVGFEQRHRVDRYARTNLPASAPTGRVRLPFAARELRGNGGLEMLAASPVAAGLGGALVTIAEKSVDENGDLYAGILDGPRRGAFRVKRRDDFDVTDGTFLPNGDLLLLERRFTLARGVAMRIARIHAEAIRPGAVLTPEILLEANGGEQIDNMEGIDAFKAADGSTHVVLVSDDNHSILQRNLLLEFRLIEK